MQNSKATWRDEYLKVICAFANADGGKFKEIAIKRPPFVKEEKDKLKLIQK